MLGFMKTSRRVPPARTIDTRRHRTLASATRVAILHLVRRSPDGVTAADAARATGRHLSTVREHLDQLAEAGLLVRERRGDGSPGRPAWRYYAGEEPETGAGPYRELAAALVAHLAMTEDDPWKASVTAGRGWGRKLAAGAVPGSAPTRLVEILERLGFTPRVLERHGDDPTLIHLLSCPFLDLVKASPDVICGLHLGVIRGALDASGSAGAEFTLEPFGRPAACVVHLSPPAAAPPSPAASGSGAARRR